MTHLAVKAPDPSHPNSGVYCIRQKTTRRMYVGSSRNLRRRRQAHFSALRHGKHHSPFLQRAFALRGEDGFEWFVLQYLPSEELLEAEQWWLDNATCAFNVSRLANRPSLSAEQRAVIGAKVAQAWADAQLRQAASDRVRRQMQDPGRRARMVAVGKDPARIAKVRAAHRARNRVYEAFGKMWCLKELAEQYGVKYGILKDRVAAGWPVEKAVLAPKRKGGL